MRMILDLNSYATIFVHLNACHVSIDEILKFQQSIYCDIQLTSNILRSMINMHESHHHVSF